MFSGSKRKLCYCAFCKSPRSIYKSRHAHKSLSVLIFTLSFVLSYIIFATVKIEALALAALFAVSAELIAQLRWRLAIVCRECGFDPVLYIRNPQIASQRVKERLEQRSQSPEALFLSPLKLPKISKQRLEEFDQNKGSILSKRS